MAAPQPHEILDVGADHGMSQWMKPLSITVAIALPLGLIAVGAALWAQRADTSSALSIDALTILGPRPITVTALPPLGALATPAGASLPGVAMTARVGGDPTQTVTVTASAVDTAGPAATTIYTAPISPVTIPPGGFADIEVVIAPVDCTRWSGPTELGEDSDLDRQYLDFSVLSTADDITVSTTPAAKATIAAALRQTCADAGARPDVAVTAARAGGEPPLETISLLVDVGADADRLVLTPLDSPGLRGLGSTDRRDGQRIPLLWLLTEAPGVARAQVTTLQVFAIRDGTAYPWIITIPLTDSYPPMVPLTPLRTPASDT